MDVSVANGKIAWYVDQQLLLIRYMISHDSGSHGSHVCAQTKATRLIGGLNSFQVMLETKTNRAMALKEVADRVKCFCDELKVIKLKYSQTGEDCLSITEERNKKSDQQTLSSVKTGMTIGQHKFIIDIRLCCMTMDTNISGVMIYLQCFSISEEGVLAVRKIQQQVSLYCYHEKYFYACRYSSLLS